MLLTLVAGWLVAGLSASVAAADATSATDRVDSMKIGYTVTPDGVLKVREEIVYRFGDSSGRHGIYRDLITREPYADDRSKDQRYDVSNVRVSSPSGANAGFTEKTTKSHGSRDQQLRIKIGSADETVDAATATYVIMYDVRGALRHLDDHSELYWDATGAGWTATLNNVTVDVTVPQGVRRTACYAGMQGATTSCDSAQVAGKKGMFAQPTLSPGEQLTIVAGIAAGAVSDDTPIVVDPPDFMERNELSVPLLAGAGVFAVGVPAAGAVAVRRSTEDERYAGLPPGSLPPTGTNVAVSKNSLRDEQVPVAFAPPRLAVAEAGLLIDAVANTHETAATLIDLAVRGGVRIENTGDEQRAVLVNGAVATAPHEQALMSALYPSLRPGESITLKKPKQGESGMRAAHDAMIDAVRRRVNDAGYYARMPSRSYGTGAAGVAVAALVLLGLAWHFWGRETFSTVNGRTIVLGATALVVIGSLALAVKARGRGRRSALGRALTDQTLGFRTYLATAEADQLKFEEGEDIFSRYLPWAIVFDLADRWQKVCAQLVAAGRIPADPVWYYGPPYYTSGWSAGSVSDTVASTFEPPPSSSGGGGGSSSGFGGGSSGGGGGGGGGGSW